MSVTVQRVFEICMDFADERSETGSIDPTNTASYKVRTPGILTALQAEMIGYGTTPTIISNMTDMLQVDDVQALTILPYKLGAELFKEENESIYDYFMKRIKELKRYERKPAVEEPIIDVYGVMA